MSCVTRTDVTDDGGGVLLADRRGDPLPDPRACASPLQTAAEVVLGHLDGLIALNRDLAGAVAVIRHADSPRPPGALLASLAVAEEREKRTRRHAAAAPDLVTLGDWAKAVGGLYGRVAECLAKQTIKAAG